MSEYSSYDQEKDGILKFIMNPTKFGTTGERINRDLNSAGLSISERIQALRAIAASSIMAEKLLPQRGNEMIFAVNKQDEPFRPVTLNREYFEQLDEIPKETLQSFADKCNSSAFVKKMIAERKEDYLKYTMAAAMNGITYPHDAAENEAFNRNGAYDVFDYFDVENQLRPALEDTEGGVEPQDDIDAINEKLDAIADPEEKLKQKIAFGVGHLEYADGNTLAQMMEKVGETGSVPTPKTLPGFIKAVGALNEFRATAPAHRPFYHLFIHPISYISDAIKRSHIESAANAAQREITEKMAGFFGVSNQVNNWAFSGKAEDCEKLIYAFNKRFEAIRESEVQRIANRQLAEMCSEENLDEMNKELGVDMEDLEDKFGAPQNDEDEPENEEGEPANDGDEPEEEEELERKNTVVNNGIDNTVENIEVKEAEESNEQELPVEEDEEQSKEKVNEAEIPQA